MQNTYVTIFVTACNKNIHLHTNNVGMCGNILHKKQRVNYDTFARFLIDYAMHTYFHPQMHQICSEGRKKFCNTQLIMLP